MLPYKNHTQNMKDNHGKKNQQNENHWELQTYKYHCTTNFPVVKSRL